ncbi:MAG: FAD-dependent oxidoreductase, partial [Calditrichota bacterium]
MAKHIVIVGGGLGGLSSAIYLASAGYQVSLFEKNERLGGKMNRFKSNGYTFDTGPSLLTLPHVIDDLFAKAGADRRDYIDIQPVDPICRYFWADGSRMDAKSDVTKMESEIAAISQEDAGQYDSYLKYCKTIYDITADIFLYNPVHELHTLMNKKTLHSLLRIAKIDPLRTMNSAVTRFFKDSRMQQLFNRYATYNGSDPFSAPATLNVIPYVEFGLGGFYILGGMYQLVEALTELAKKLGVQLFYNSPIEKIRHHGGRIKGVEINGDFLAAD